VEKALEVGVKKVTDRRRPAKDVPDARLRDDAPTDGPSYPSGHAGIAYAAVTLAAPYLPPLGTTAVATAATLATVTRIHQGAHFPLDAVGGALLGVAVGSGLNAVFGLPSAARSA
jgi:membrane-associated phospholipid phosphatase